MCVNMHVYLIFSSAQLLSSKYSTHTEFVKDKNLINPGLKGVVACLSCQGCLDFLGFLGSYACYKVMLTIYHIPFYLCTLFSPSFPFITHIHHKISGTASI